MRQLFLILLSSWWAIDVCAVSKYYFISNGGAGDIFWNVEFNGAKQAAEDLKLDLQILSPETPNDIARQVELLNAAIASDPLGIATSVPDGRSFSKSLQTAQHKNIRVIAFNSRPEVADGTKNPYVAYVGMDEYKAGIKVGERAFATGRVKERAVVAIHLPGHIGLEKRAKGISEVLSKHGIVVDKLDITTDPSQVQQIVQSYLQKNSNVSAIFTLGPLGTHPIGKLIEKGKVKIYCAAFDLSLQTLELIRSKIVDFTVDQQPFMQGYMSIVQLALAHKTSITPSEIDTGVAFVDASNVNGVDSFVQKGYR